MRTYFIPHKIKVGDITHLSDKDSEFLISENVLNVEDPVNIESLEGTFVGIITDIDKTSVEIEIKEKVSGVKTKEDFSITIIQSILADSKFNFFIEKSVEIGVHNIIPVESKYSTISKNKSIKRFGTYKKTIAQAKEQSRNPNEIKIEKPINLKSLEGLNVKHKICLATEVEDAVSLEKSLSEKEPNSSYAIAVGPERGWGVSDIKVFRELGFEFVKLKSNILRTETAGLVISSILNFKAGKY